MEHAASCLVLGDRVKEKRPEGLLLPQRVQGRLLRSMCLIRTSTMTVGGNMSASGRQYKLQGNHEETLVLALHPPTL